MSVSPADLIAYAEKIAAASPFPEVAVRNSVGRAYYAAYHDSLAWNSSLPFPGQSPDDKTGSHNRLAWALRTPHAATARDTKINSVRRGILIRKLHADRVSADYKLDDPVEPSLALQAIEDAKTILSIV